MKYFTNTIFNNKILYEKIHKELFNEIKLYKFPDYETKIKKLKKKIELIK
jgi:hypothetical protein